MLAATLADRTDRAGQIAGARHDLLDRRGSRPSLRRFGPAPPIRPRRSAARVDDFVPSSRAAPIVASSSIASTIVSAVRRCGGERRAESSVASLSKRVTAAFAVVELKLQEILSE